MFATIKRKMEKDVSLVGCAKLSRRTKKRLGFHATARILLGPAIPLYHYQVKP
jgi:hypothetical protein